MSVCITGCCLAHRREVFIRLDLGAPYPWAHSAGMSSCEGIPPATAEQAEEVCACRHERHEAVPGPLPHGLIAKPRACTQCPCPDFRHRWQEAVA